MSRMEPIKIIGDYPEYFDNHLFTYGLQFSTNMTTVQGKNISSYLKTA